MSGLGRPVNGEVPSFQTSENTLGTHSSARPISTPNRNPTAPTPFCSPTGYGIFGGSPMVCDFMYVYHKRFVRTLTENPALFLVNFCPEKAFEICFTHLFYTNIFTES